ncbi:MAG: PEP-CTERM sorting domain-containing protein [Acidobacteria bacterium]|nr:PEP-CTERM sorting domain-containing protein [Acidobacteriota bacterium]
MKTILLAALAATVLSVCAPGAVIFDNGAPNLIAGDNMSEFLMAEDFSLTGTYDLTNIRFWSLQSTANDYRGSVYWAIHSDGASAPGAIAFGGVTAAIAGVATGNSAGAPLGYAEYVYDINPGAVQLTAGTYWLALHNGPLANIDPAEMLWETTSTGSGLAGRYFDTTWVSTDQEHAFLIEGNRVVGGQVPEPGSLMLLGSGLALVLLRLKGRK